MLSALGLVLALSWSCEVLARRHAVARLSLYPLFVAAIALR